MKNRAMLLCLKNHIDSIEEYARRIGVSPSRAEAILKEQVVLTQEEIDANCFVFGVKADYFLCLVE